MTDHDENQEFPCILKVTDGAKTKFSTKVRQNISVLMSTQHLTGNQNVQVSSSELNKFHAAYGSLLKSSMAELRKRDKKREKANAEQAAKRKKRMTEPVTVEGPKRGNGRRKRQRQLKAALKQQESQKKFKEREEARKKAEVVPS